MRGRVLVLCQGDLIRSVSCPVLRSKSAKKGALNGGGDGGNDDADAVWTDTYVEPETVFDEWSGDTIATEPFDVRVPAPFSTTRAFSVAVLSILTYVPFWHNPCRSSLPRR